MILNLSWNVFLCVGWQSEFSFTRINFCLSFVLRDKNIFGDDFELVLECFSLRWAAK
jgi:hypothetical protein